MKRRHLLLSAILVPWAVRAETPPWRSELLMGGFDGSAWQLGFKVLLSPGWKTYWRVPGDGGIAPDLKIVGDNVLSAIVKYPLPKRFTDEAGMTIGFKDEVVFPILVTPAQPEKPVLFQFNAFIGVCDVVCIPAQVAKEAGFDPANAQASGQLDISRWMAKVPTPRADGPVASARAILHQGKPALELALRSPVDDVFVEGNPLHYFGPPAMAEGKALLTASGAKSIEELKATPLRITIDAGGEGLEQTIIPV